MDFVLIPGAWMGEWAWEAATDRLHELGHDVHPVTMSGLADENTDVSDVGLETHVGDVLSVLEAGDLRNVLVVGHSYSGVVAGQVADRAPDRVSHTVFVEAFLPRDGKSMLDAFPEDQREEELRQIAENGAASRPRVPWKSRGSQTSPGEQARWLAERLVDHPGCTVSEPAVLDRPLAEQRTTYIACSIEISDEVAAMCEEANWTILKMEPGHWPMVSRPDELVTLLKLSQQWRNAGLHRGLAEPGGHTEAPRMAYDGAMGPTVLEERLKADLRRAIRARDRAAVAALRTAVAAIDNAGSVGPREDGRTKIAGKAADVPRRELTEEEVVRILRQEVDALGAGIAAAERHGSGSGPANCGRDGPC